MLGYASRHETVSGFEVHESDSWMQRYQVRGTQLSLVVVFVLFNYLRAHVHQNRQ